MNILIEIGHPAHVHFFRRVVEKVKSEGHKVIIVTRNKEITNRLLDGMSIEYISLSTPSSSKAGMLFELLRRWFLIWRILGKGNIDTAVSISGLSTAFPARLRWIPNLTITDTEDATISNFIAFLFSDLILTPDFFLKELGPKQVRYYGLHELAYLRDFDLSDLQQRLSEIGLTESYSIIRLIAYDAAHDWRLKAPSEESILSIAKYLENYGKVYITSQKKLKGKLKDYELQIPITQIHYALAGARIFVGESPTMAVEASLLGTPAFLISERSRNLGNMVRLEEIGILRNLSSWKELERELGRISDLQEFRDAWLLRSQSFVKSTIDIDEVVIGHLKNLANDRPSQ